MHRSSGHYAVALVFFFFSSRRRHTRWPRDWSSDVCSSDLVMANDAVSLAVLCLVSADTLRVGLPRGLAIAVGAVLVVVGVSTKVWAARTLSDGYYWGNFFAPEEQVVPTTAGPYRWLTNPMYTRC